MRILDHENSRRFAGSTGVCLLFDLSFQQLAGDYELAAAAEPSRLVLPNRNLPWLYPVKRVAAGLIYLVRTGHAGYLWVSFARCLPKYFT